MELRIDSNLKSTLGHYWITVSDNQAQLTKQIALGIKYKTYTLTTDALMNALYELTSQSLELFAQNSKLTSGETWQLLFDVVEKIQTSCTVTDQTPHRLSIPGFVDCWKLTAKGEDYIKIQVEIFDHCDSNYCHDYCEHEATGEVAFELMKSFDVSNHKDFMQRAGDFTEEQWKELHNSMPTSQGCNWLNEWRG